MASSNVILFVLLFVNIALTRATPRDSTVVHAQTPTLQDAESHVSAKEQESTHTDQVPEVPISGRVSCQHEEATEDELCLEHCVPKGYSYGLCVSGTCSCI